MLIYIILLALANYALASLIAKSKLFESTRAHLSSKYKFFKQLLSCEFCVSCWTAIIPLLLFGPILLKGLSGLILGWLATIGGTRVLQLIEYKLSG